MFRTPAGTAALRPFPGWAAGTRSERGMATVFRKLEEVILKTAGQTPARPPERQVRVMVAGNDEPRCRQIGELLAKQGLSFASGLMVSLELAADRASRMNPDILLVALDRDPEASIAAIRQTRASSTAYIVAVGPAHDAPFILRTLHEGADEYLDEARFAEDLPGALARFGAKRQLRAQQAAPGKVISVIGASGGAGVSTIAANVAGLLARNRRSCGLVDLRLESGDLAALLGLAPQHTVAEFAANAGRIDRNVLDQMFTRHTSGLELLAAPWDARQTDMVTPQTLRLLLAMSRAKFDYLVLDLDNRFHELHVEALWQSDAILVVTRLDFISVRNARRLLDRLLEMGIEPSRLQVVANRVGQARELPRAQAETALGTRISHCVADDPGRVNLAANEGKLVWMRYGWSTISRNLGELATAVNGKHD
jgi:pilus assembly protein CpaE